jgi:hypothetical protein
LCADETKFKAAIAIVANNDLKHEICKVRAAAYARRTKQRIVWSPATDYAAVECLSSDPELMKKKEEWLQLHNRKCAGLWGMVPLVKGMRVALIDHLDRSDKCLLRGSCGELMGWVLEDGESLPKRGVAVLKRPPKALIVKFDNAEWILEGMCEAGTYPVKVAKKTWFVDENRMCPVLRVSRTQTPVGPDYARTAYSTQGLTLDAAIVDLCFDENTDPTTAYIAMSRVRCADDILIMQAFNIDIFRQGIPIGPAMLMKHLRGEDLEADIAAHLAAEDSRIAAEKQKKKQAAKQRQKLNEQQRGKRDRTEHEQKRGKRDRTEYMTEYEQKRGKRDRTEYEQKRGKRDKTQAQKDKAKITRKKKRAASKDKGSKIFDQSRQDAANAECETLGAFRNA